MHESSVLVDAPPSTHLDADDDRGPANRSGRVRRRLRLLRRPGLVLSVVVLVVVTLLTAVPGLFTGSDPYAVDPGAYLVGPSWEHPFGTDSVGHDLFARVVFGARGSVTAALIAVVVSFAGGAALGLLAGYFGGRIDDLIMRAVDVLYAIPALLLALVVVTALGFGTTNIGVAVGVVGIATFTRLMRSEVIRVRTMQYVEASYSSGGRHGWIVLRHVLPNSWGSVLALATLDFGTALLAISAISFLGFGTPPPTPEWGSMIAEGRYYLSSAWWLTTFPGIVLALTVVAANRLSRALEGDAHDG